MSVRNSYQYNSQFLCLRSPSRTQAFLVVVQSDLETPRRRAYVKQKQHFAMIDLAANKSHYDRTASESHRNWNEWRGKRDGGRDGGSVAHRRDADSNELEL